MWDERISGHPLFKALEEFGPLLNQAKAASPAVATADAEIVEPGLQRLGAILSFVGKRLEGADNLLIQPGPLDSMLSSFSDARTSLNAFISDHATGHIQNANNSLDSALGHLAQINAPWTSDEIGALRDAGNQYRAAMENDLRSIREKAAALETFADERQEQLQVLRADIESASQFNRTESDTELNAVKALITTEKTRADGVITDFQSQFLSGQNERLAAFNTAMDDYRAKLTDHQVGLLTDREAIRKAHQDLMKEQHDEFVRAATGMREDIQRKKAEAEKLVGIIADTGMTSGYRKTADTAKYSTWVWQSVTVAAIAGLIWWLIGTMPSLPDIDKLGANVPWASLVIRLVISLAFGALAQYAATQADKNHQLQNANRKLELELAAVGPYVEPLPKEDRDKFLISLADRVFGRDESGCAEIEKPSPATIMNVLNSPDTRDLIEKFGTNFRSIIPDIIAALQKYAPK
jgi:hypothetical protein